MFLHQLNVNKRKVIIDKMLNNNNAQYEEDKMGLDQLSMKSTDSTTSSNDGNKRSLKNHQNA